MSDESERELAEKKARRERTKAENAAHRRETVDPNVQNAAVEKVWVWLDSNVWHSGSPEKIVVHVAKGRHADRLGAVLKEYQLKPHTPRPDKEELARMANEIWAICQDDTDARGVTGTARFCVVCWDLHRCAVPYGRVTLALRKSGLVAQPDEGDDDEPDNVKLLLGLLNEERRDRRWMHEQTMHALSGVMEMNAERMEKMEAVVDNAWQRQTAFLEATEKMLNQAADRQQRAAWMAWRQEKFSLLLDKGIAAAEIAFPALMGKKSGNPLAAWLDSVTDVQGLQAFGALDGSGHVAGAVFTDEQFQLFVKLARSEKQDDGDVSKLIASITPEQVQAAQRIFDERQLVGLAQWITSRAQANGAGAGVTQ